MNYYNWKEIFKSKTEAELFSIFAGNSALDSEAEIYAGSELLDRGFNIEKIIEIAHQKSIAYKDNFLKASNPNKLKQYETFYNSIFWFAFIPFLMFIFIWTIKMIINGEHDYYFPIAMLIISIFSIIDRKRTYRRYQLDIEKEILDLKMKMELLDDKILKKCKTAPNNS